MGQASQGPLSPQRPENWRLVVGLRPSSRITAAEVVFVLEDFYWGFGQGQNCGAFGRGHGSWMWTNTGNGGAYYHDSDFVTNGELSGCDVYRLDHDPQS